MTMRDTPAYGIPDLARRRFLGGAGLLIAFAATGTRQKAHAAGEQPGLHVIQGSEGTSPNGGFKGFEPGGYIRIPPTGPITIIAPNVEMGQGIYTGQAMLICEELEVGLDQIQVVAAPPNEALYKQPQLKSQSTGGSTSIRGAWTPLRQAGAAARTMLIAAAAQQWGVPVSECTAQRAVVTHRPSGRTLGYGELAEAAAHQPVPQSVALKDPKDFTLIGKPAPRVDTPSKTDGSAIFGIDVRVPGMKVATVAACPTRGGKLSHVDDAPARQIPGVRDVVRIDDAVAVMGDHFWAAKRGLAALDITWDDGPNAHLSSPDIIAALRDAHQNGTPIMARRVGDADGAMGSAAKRVEVAYELPFLAHATMEPINTTVHVRPDACEIWVGTQVPTMAQKVAADITGLPLEKVIVHNYLLGGGFGRRLSADSIAQAVAIAKQVSYPVKIIWSREEDIQHDQYRPAYYDRISAGLDANGMPTAWVDHVGGGSVMASYVPGGLPEGKLDADAVEGAAEPPYDLPNIQVDWVRKDPPFPVLWWRGVGPTHNVYVVESFVDELAQEAGKDPVQYRLALLGKNPRAANVLKLVAERSGWGNPLPAGSGRGVAVHNSFGSYLAVVLEIAVTPAGEIQLKHAHAVMDCGLAINPDQVRAQVEGGLIFGLTAAMYSDITFQNGRVMQSNFNDYRMLRIDQSPPVDVYVVPSTESPGGIGETGTVSAAPVLGNAIFAATGQRLRRYPFDRTQLRGKAAPGVVVSSREANHKVGAD